MCWGLYGEKVNYKIYEIDAIPQNPLSNTVILSISTLPANESGTNGGGEQQQSGEEGLYGLRVVEFADPPKRRR